MIEEQVKEILLDYKDSEIFLEEASQQICQLYEPKPDEGLREEIRLLLANAEMDCDGGGDYSPCRPVLINETKVTDQILAKVASHYQALEEHCSELVSDVIRLEAELQEAPKHPCVECEYEWNDSGCQQIICPHQITNKGIVEEAEKQ